MGSSYRRIIGFLALAAALGTGIWMYLRVADGELWGYAPLLLYGSLYTGIYLLATFRPDGSVRGDNILSAASGLLLGFGFPGLVPFPALLFVALVPLLVLHRKLLVRRAGYRAVFLHGFSAFVLYNLLATYWVTNTAFFAGVFAILVNSCLMSLPWLFYYWTALRSPKVAYLGFASAWVAFEFLHYNWSLNWPWLTLGNGFMQFPALVQWYEWTGVFGGTVWLLAVNYLAYRCLAPATLPSHPRPRKNYLLLAVVVLLPVIASLIRYRTYAPPASATISVAAIQPNFEPHFEKFSRNPSAQLDTFLRLSETALAAGPVDYLIYPETSFGNIDEDAPEESATFVALRESLAGKANYLVSGIDAYHVFEPGEALTPAVRHQRSRQGGTIAFEALNAVVQLPLAPDEHGVQTYRKGVFVPGAESFPFSDVLFFLEPLVRSLGGTVAGRGTQATRDPLVGERARAAPVICYESVFGEYFTDYVRAGAQVVFVMTNDGWWDNTAGHRQHLWLSSLRAIETRREVVRSANVGACAFIDQRGKILVRTSYDREGFLRGEMHLNDARTLYVRTGDLLARVGLLLFVMILLSNMARTLRPAAFSEEKA